MIKQTRVNYDRSSVTSTHKYPRQVGEFLFKADGRMFPTQAFLTSKRDV